MIRKIFLAVLLLIVVMGCSRGEGDDTLSAISTYDSSAINFISQATKAVSNGVDVMEGDESGFVVYGVEADDFSWYDYLDGNRYIYNSVAQRWEWESEEDPSWPVSFSRMNFYAYYPASATGFTLTSSAPVTLVGEVVVESSVLNQTDYLASSSGDVVTKPLTGVQPLNFAHIMSKVSFSVLQDEGILTVIRQLGLENIISEGSYDYINLRWNNLSNSTLTSFDDYVGSSGPFAKYGVEDQIDPIRIDGHYLMLIPQMGGAGEGQTPIWDGSITVDNSGDLVPNGAYISIRYRTNSDTEDIIGYAFRRDSSNETEWDTENYFYNVYKKDGGSYTGPLYIKAGFKLSEDQLNWVAGTEYDYTLQLDKTGGIYLSEYYYDVDGKNTKIKVRGMPQVGDPVFATDVSVVVTVDGWNYSDIDIYSM
ncbi:MAG: fimbrillin family protein [Rikenellaceae bacterium]